MAQDFNLITLSGTIAGQEIWSTSCAYQTDFGTGPVKTFDDLQAWADAVASLSSTPYTMLIPRLSNVVTVNTARAAYIDGAGKTAQVAEAGFSTPWTGNVSPVMPPQSSVVLSLLTGRPGRSYRGRMYWPCLNASFDTGKVTLTPAVVGTLAENAAQLLTDIGDAAGVDFAMKPAVASTVLGVQTLVTEVRVGTVVDTQRRRRNQLQETYGSSAVPPA